MSSSQAPAATTARVSMKPQTLREAYDPPANVLEIDVSNPETHGVGNRRFTDYEVKMKVICILNFFFFKFNSILFFNQTNLPVFRLKESTVRRRFSDFEWLKNELERGSKVKTHHKHIYQLVFFN